MNNNRQSDLIEFYTNFLITNNKTIISRLAKKSRITTREKGEILIRPDAGTPATIFLLDGVMKTYIVSPDGRETTYGFYYKPGTGVSMTKEMINIPEIWCKTLTHCTLIEIVDSSPYEIAEEFPELYKEILFAWEPVYYDLIDRLRAVSTLKKDRYLWFLKKHRPLADKISLAEIALYLGIQPQSLSRIRAELAEEQGVTPPEKLTIDNIE